MSININIISGFLGAGKTTFLKKIIPNIEGKKALIENEFGDSGIDGDLINDKLPIKEIYAGCICCSLVKDFRDAIEEIALEYKPDNILIEPSGVGSLSDVIKSCKKISENSDRDIKINNLITIVDVSSFDEYIDNFGSFYIDQIENANIIFLSHFGKIDKSEVERVISKIRLSNEKAFIFNEDWFSYSGEKIVEIIDIVKKYEIEYKEKLPLMSANKVFTTFSIPNPRIFSEYEITKTLESLNNNENGYILRSKGIVKASNNKFIYFDYTPNHCKWEYINECSETKIAVIGSNLRKEKILEYFN